MWPIKNDMAKVVTVLNDMKDTSSGMKETIFVS